MQRNCLKGEWDLHASRRIANDPGGPGTLTTDLAGVPRIEVKSKSPHRTAPPRRDSEIAVRKGGGHDMLGPLEEASGRFPLL
ncbi:hypothetical protein NDU88_001783 [Pleurodeles waltl]|uniref:Uncharacterized protein n=1 Tax=Pleurodeles waltl TaxID=8319 RepID=A0AAV7LCE2_PLEWA|nr:hypothetical protein NDU88_001783 [Pleurodeles waltl]